MAVQPAEKGIEAFGGGYERPHTTSGWAVLTGDGVTVYAASIPPVAEHDAWEAAFQSEGRGENFNDWMMAEKGRGARAFRCRIVEDGTAADAANSCLTNIDVSRNFSLSTKERETISWALLVLRNERNLNAAEWAENVELIEKLQNV